VPSVEHRDYVEQGWRDEQQLVGKALRVPQADHVLLGWQSFDGAKFRVIHIGSKVTINLERAF
jgi:hypothetical protein